MFSCDFSKKTIQEKDNKELVVIIKNKLGISTNIGSGISITDFSRLDYNTDKRIDTMWIDVERYKKLYVRNENDFKHVIFIPLTSIYDNLLIVLGFRTSRHLAANDFLPNRVLKYPLSAPDR